MKFRTGVSNDGKLQGMHLQTLADGGGYGSYGVASTFYKGALQTVTSELPRYRFEAARVFTNKPPCGPKRGHGTPQPRFGQEIQLDKIAERLQKDPAELRLGMLAKPNSLTANWLKIGSIGLEQCIRTVVERSDWKQRFRKLPHGKGIGLACGSYLCGAGLPIYWNKMPQSGVQLLLDRSGQVTVFCGATEIGQGSDDVLAAIVAEVLGIDPFDIRCITGDTGITPVDLGSYSSRVTVMMGNAAIVAAEKLKKQIAEAAAEHLEVAPDRLVFANGRVAFESRSMNFADAVVLVHKIPSLLEYKSITSLDMPEVDTVLIEDPDPNCPFGAKEAGQGPLLPVMPAVANAIYDAVGVRIDELPITPDKVLRALELKAAGKSARIGPEHFPVVPYPKPMIVAPPWEGGDGNETKRNDAAAVV